MAFLAYFLKWNRYFSDWKFVKFLMSFLKTDVSFLSNFAAVFSAIKHNSSVVFSSYITLYILGGDTHMTSMKIFQFSRPPHPRCSSASKILPSPWPWTSNFARPPPPPSRIDKQSIKGKHNLRLTITCYQLLLSGRLSFLASTH